ncbi:MAG: PH domain-containing protein [Hydrogenophaga sp.]
MNTDPLDPLTQQRIIQASLSPDGSRAFSHGATGTADVQDGTLHSETDILWSASEGQVANAGVFALATLTFWLVLPVFYALYRYLRSANHRYTLTNQRLVEETGIFIKNVEAVELYRVKDLSVSGTLAQTLFGRGRIIIQSTDTTSPSLLINAVASPKAVSSLIRDAAERCRSARGVRAFDF